MDLSALKTQIKAGELEDFYIFTGPEGKVTRLYIDQMSKVSNCSVKILDSITELAPKIHNTSMLQARFIYVLYDCKEFLSSDELQRLITQNNTFSQRGIVVLVYTNLDKRSKLYKNFKDKIIEVDYLKPSVLTKYIQRDVELSETNCAKLIDICGQDYGQILLEVDKINQYALAKNVSANIAFETLLREGVIVIPGYDAVFDFVDAVLKGQCVRAFRLLKASTEASGAISMLPIISNLYTSAKHLLQVQGYDRTGKITDATGLTPFQVKLASERRGHYSNGDLVYLMKLVREAEKGIKTGAIEESMAVPYILVNLW